MVAPPGESPLRLLPGGLIGFWAERQEQQEATGSPLRMRQAGLGFPVGGTGPSGVLSEDKPDPHHQPHQRLGVLSLSGGEGGPSLEVGLGAAWVWGARPGPATGLMSPLLLLGLIALFTVTHPRPLP